MILGRPKNYVEQRKTEGNPVPESDCHCSRPGTKPQHRSCRTDCRRDASAFVDGCSDVLAATPGCAIAYEKDFGDGPVTGVAAIGSISVWTCCDQCAYSKTGPVGPNDPPGSQPSASEACRIDGENDGQAETNDLCLDRKEKSFTGIRKRDSGTRIRP